MAEKRITFVNAYSVGNRGDAGIVIAMVHLVRRLYPEARIRVMSNYAQENRPLLEAYGVESVPSPWPFEAHESVAAKYRHGLGAFARHLLRRDDPAMAPLAEADLVLSVGGGYVYSARRGPGGVGFVHAMFHLHLATKLNRPTVLMPQSLGPIRWGLDRRLARRVLSRLDWVFVRDEPSHRLAEELNLPRVSRCIDTAMALLDRPAPPDLPSLDRGRPAIGITAINWLFARPGTSQAELQRYLDKLAEAIGQLRAQHPGLHAYVFPQVTVGEADSPHSDAAVCRQLADRLGDAGEYVDLETIQQPEALIGLYRQMDLFIAGRLHSAIFALLAERPTIGMAYQPKTRGLYNLLGLSDWVLDIQAFQPQELAHLAGRALEGQAALQGQVRQAVRSASDQVVQQVTHRLAQVMERS